MKNILITQKVNFEILRGYSLTLEKNWIDYAKKININLIPYNHNLKSLKQLKIDGIIFSGGNDLHNKKKKDLIRYNEDVKLLKKVINTNIPKLFICYGFQLLSNFFGIKSYKITNHVGNSHSIYIKNSKIFENKYKKFSKIKVNSFHNFGVFQAPDNFEILSTHYDNSLEIIQKYDKKILCLMFHPERKNFSQLKVDKMIKNFFK